MTTTATADVTTNPFASGITQVATITAAGLELLGVAADTLSLSNAVGTVAANTSGGAVSVTTSGAATVGTVNTVGVTTGSQSFTLKTNAGGITVTNAINAGTANVTLNPFASGITKAATITAAGVGVLGEGAATVVVGM